MIDRDKEFYITTGLSMCIARLREMLPQDKMRMMEHRISKGIDFYRQETRKIPMDKRPDIEHAAIDSLLKIIPGFDQATCKKGCATCCHIGVQTTESEAKQLANLIKTGEVKIDMDLLREQAAFTGDDFAYATQPREKSRCVFLGDDNACRVYEKRPTNCRKYLVRSDPKNCVVDGVRKPEVLASVDLETMASGFFDLDRNFDYMPKSILRHL